jgi:hypothetical protein
MMSPSAGWVERLLDFRIIHPIIAASAVVATGVLWLFRFAFTRHREFLAFSGHMKREEEQVWPELQQQMAANHEATMRRLDAQDQVLHAHGERISSLEGKMPNGEIGQIKKMVSDLWERRGKARG